MFVAQICEFVAFASFVYAIYEAVLVIISIAITNSFKECVVSGT